MIASASKPALFSFGRLQGLQEVDALFDAGRIKEALRLAEITVARDPENPIAHQVLAASQIFSGQADASLASLATAIRVSPRELKPYMRMMRGSALLLAGQYEEGWRDYEWRWLTGLPDFQSQLDPRLLWEGEALNGRTLLVTAEQGFGDNIQFARFASRISTDGVVKLAVPEPLRQLLSTVPGVSSVTATAPAHLLPPFDFHCPIMSLPNRLGISLETLAGPRAYVAADPVHVAFWKERLAHLPGLRIGLVWAGNPLNARCDPVRSLPLLELASFGQVRGASFVALQQGPAALDAVVPPPGLNLFRAGGLRNFADTAALIEALDLVITVDTAVAHLAGALGKPVWLLNRFDTCWRWLLDREDSPWYPSMRVFRQPKPGEWASVIERVASELAVVSASQDGFGMAT